MSVELVKPSAIAKHEGVEEVEAAMLNLPQAACVTVHRFGPGIYIREITMPAGSLVIGHSHKYPHTNVVLKGTAIVQLNGDMQTIVAPSIFVSDPGRKMLYIVEECVWQNIYATDETDIDKLDAMFVDKSDTWTDHDNACKKLLLGEE